MAAAAMLGIMQTAEAAEPEPIGRAVARADYGVEPGSSL
jgi:hypothetical protein